MDYTHYQLEDFVLDHDFQQWVYRPGPEADQFWKNYIVQHPEKEPLLEQARQILLTLRLDQHHLEASEVQQLKASIHEKIAETEEATIYSEPSHVRLARQGFQVWLKRAAVFIGFLLAGSLLFWFLSLPEEMKYTTGFNETKTILLPDSSTVILNANTVLSMKGEWEKASERVVNLEGEAFFQVKEKPHLGHQKFIVNTENASVEVLGTEFNVNNRRQKTEVVLRSGKVKLSNHLIQDKDVYMEPGELAALSIERPEIIQQKVEPEKYISWINNKLILDNTSLQTVAELLEDHYGFEVVIEDPQQSERKFSATTTLTLDDVDMLLDLIEKSFNVQVTKNGKQILIRDE